VTSVNDIFLLEHARSKLVLNFLPRAIPGDDVSARATELTRGAKFRGEIAGALRFRVKKIRTVDLPLGALGYSAATECNCEFRLRQLRRKAFLLAALCEQVGISANPALADPPDPASELVPSTIHIFANSLGLKTAGSSLA